MKKIKRLVTGAVTLATMAATTVTAYAASDITNPLSGQQGSVGGVVNSASKWALGAIAAVAGSFFMFHLYKAIITWMAGSHHAQKREEAKSHLLYVFVSGVMLGASGVIAGALYNLGATFH